MSKTVKIIVIAIVLLFGIAILVYSRQAVAPDADKQGYNETSSSDQIVGNDSDEHGCIASAGYSWCGAKEKCLRVFEEFCPGQAADLADKIKAETGIILNEKGNVEFNWIAGDGTTTADVKIAGVEYAAEGIKMADYLKLEKYMYQAFQPDNNNMADGVEGGLRGYVDGYMVCDMDFRHKELKTNEDGISEPVGDSLNLDLKCGFFNPNTIPDLVAVQNIKELLGMKYDLGVNTINVEVLKKDESHLAGSIDLAPGKEGGKGLFLAVKQEGIWQLVFDGNGSIDCEKMRSEYGFSDEILQPNFCD